MNKPKDNRATIPSVIAEIGAQNTEFVKAHPGFEDVQEGQEPRVILVHCSDSRVEASSVGNTFNNVFGIENAGNRANDNAHTDSITYAAYHIPSAQIIYVLGHTGCGAVTAAIGDHSGEKTDLREGLGSMWKYLQPMEGIVRDTQVPKGVDIDFFKAVAFAELNVDFQVASLMDRYADLVQAGKLTVVGGMFDIHGLYPGPKGTVTPINIEGTTRLDELRNHPHLGQLTSEATQPFRFTQYDPVRH